MKHEEQEFEVVVCGGGMAGVCAAIASARKGVRTALVQNRPVLGGNASSEIRVTVHGAGNFHAYARETGIISEMLIEERARNHEEINENGWTNSVFDLVLLDFCQREENLTLFLNTDITDVELSDGRLGTSLEAEPHTEQGYYLRPSIHKAPARIAAVHARVFGAEKTLRLSGKMFIDCTGDALVGHLAGCEWRMGTESHDEFGEILAPLDASTDVMGNSIHFKLKDMGRPVPFDPPSWVKQYPDPAFFYEQGRAFFDHHIGGFWWIEIGVPWHTIHDAEDIRHELTAHALGIWNFMKNVDPKLKVEMANYALDWFGQVPGKRESRRIMGQYFMPEQDIFELRAFEDEVAHGGWFIDLHTPGGLLAPSSEPSAVEDFFTGEGKAKKYCGPYGVPLRCLIAKDADNLLMAGRNVSVTHAALGTVRVMATTAVLGQAVGTAAAMAVSRSCAPTAVAEAHAVDLREALMRDGVWLPHHVAGDPADCARQATATASSEALLHGVSPDMPSNTPGHEEHFWHGSPRHNPTPLERIKAQFIAVGPEGLTTVSACLSNDTDEPQAVNACLWKAAHIWDYRGERTDKPLAQTTLQVPPGKHVWVNWTFDAPVQVDGYVRLDIGPNEHVYWDGCPHIIPGHVSAYAMQPQKYRRYGDGCALGFKVEPAQSVFAAGNVLTGVTRPGAGTNLWRSDPGQPLPQWIELTWDKPQSFQTVELTFPGHLLREYHRYEPFFRDPQCPRDFSLQVQADDGWRTVAVVEGNYQRQRQFKLETPVTTSRMRVVVTATNGDPSAAIYEIRVYA